MNAQVAYFDVLCIGPGKVVELGLLRTNLKKHFGVLDSTGATKKTNCHPFGKGWRFGAARLGLMALLHLFAPAWAASARLLPVDTNYLVKAWTPGEGLPQSSINSMAQTPDGYLWLGTFNGLARFDGVRFVVFNPVNTPALRSARIVSLNVDRNGWLWIMTEEGFLTRVADGGFEAMNGRWGLTEGRTFPRGTDPDGNLWLSREDRPGTEWMLRGREFVSGELRDFSTAEILRVVAAARCIWLPRAGPAGNVWEKGSTDSLRFGIEAAFGVRGPSLCVPARNGDAWVVTHSAVGKLRHGGLQRLPDGISIDEPTDAAEDHAGNLLIGTWTQGLLIYTPDGRLQSIPIVGGASARAVRVVMVDHEGNPWIGTDLAGVQRLHPRVFRTLLGAETGQSGVVRSIAEDRSGKIWRATQEGLDIVSEYSGVAKVVAAVHGDEQLWWAITADREGQIWAGSMGVDFCRFAGTRAEKYFQIENVRVLAPAVEGGVWIGTERGILRANLDSLNEEQIPAGMTNHQVRAIVELDGRVWAGLFGSGVWRKDRSGWSQFGAEQGLADRHVISLYADTDATGTLWVGTTFGGLHRLKDGVFKDFRTAGSRLPAMVACIIGDDVGFLWLGSLDGIYRVAKRELNEFADGTRTDLIVEKYDRSDGLQTTEMSEGRQPTVLRARDGRLWFATINGLSVVDPKTVPQNLEPPPVLIEEVSVNGNPVPTVVGRELEIAALSQRVAFQYTGISLKGGSRVRFKRRLAGLESEWEDAGAERTATYYNLPPGPYRFEVLAANESGIWSRTAATMSVRALPAYWQARWFRNGTGLLLVGVVMAGVMLRLRALAHAQAAREAFSQQLIDSQEQERRRISAGLHDGLGQALLVVKHQAGQAARTPGAPPEAVERWARVAQSTQAAIDEVRGIVSALRPAMLESIGLSGALAAMLQQTAESGEVKLTWKVADMAGAILGGRDIELYRVVQEALNNILKHSRAAHARIELRREPDRWVLEIEDDGCGFDETATLAGGGPGGFGLRGMRERLRILGGSLILVTRPGAGVRLRAEAPINEH